MRNAILTAAELMQHTCIFCAFLHHSNAAELETRLRESVLKATKGPEKGTKTQPTIYTGSLMRVPQRSHKEMAGRTHTPFLGNGAGQSRCEHVEAYL